MITGDHRVTIVPDAGDFERHLLAATAAFHGDDPLDGIRSGATLSRVFFGAGELTDAPVVMVAQRITPEVYAKLGSGELDARIEIIIADQS